ncbi:MAG: hypothetical protein AB7Q97_13680 [Gammaproteobacteria bacterium]
MTALHAPSRATGESPDGFLHHPSEFPLRYRRLRWDRWWHPQSPDAPLGLAFASPYVLDIGTRLELSIPLRGVEQRFRGEVVLVRALERGYEVGVWLDSAEDAQRARLVEQICALECTLRRKRSLRGASPSILRNSHARLERALARIAAT